MLSMDAVCAVQLSARSHYMSSLVSFPAYLEATLTHPAFAVSAGLKTNTQLVASAQELYMIRLRLQLHILNVEKTGAPAKEVACDVWV